MGLFEALSQNKKNKKETNGNETLHRRFHKSSDSLVFPASKLHFVPVDCLSLRQHHKGLNTVILQ